MQLFKYRLNKISKYATGKILDIGFSLMPNKYLKGEVIGLDINKPEVLPSNYNIFIQGSIYSIPFKENTFDTIVLSGIIEHLENPLKALKECNRVLKPNGKILIETPNPYYLPVVILDIFNWKRFYFKDTHLSLFPKRIMIKLLWLSGFDLDKVKSCGFNIRESLTCPSPNFLAQDFIYIAYKRQIKDKYYKQTLDLHKFQGALE